MNALLQDLQAELPYIQGRKLQSIFFGGGTPSLMSAHGVGKLLSAAENLVGFEQAIEITLEANPGTAEQQRFRDYRLAGVNRLSLGAQSFDDRQLQKLGRIHTADGSRRAIDALRTAGFDNFNLDLMFALPGQTLDGALADLHAAMALQPTHLSWYQLTIEPNTVFHRERPILPDDDLQYEILQAGQQLLAAAGYRQYETSAYSQDGHICVHNRNYWEFGDYLGIGAGAHGKVSRYIAGTLQVRRRQKTRVPEHYLQAIDPCSSDQAIDEKELPVEFALNALRLIDGVPREYFMQRTGLPFAVIENRVQQLQMDGLVAADETRLAPTAKGALFLNNILERFL